jgi:hypothetical protein
MLDDFGDRFHRGSGFVPQKSERSIEDGLRSLVQLFRDYREREKW